MTTEHEHPEGRPSALSYDTPSRFVWVFIPSVPDASFTFLSIWAERTSKGLVMIRRKKVSTGSYFELNSICFSSYDTKYVSKPSHWWINRHYSTRLTFTHHHFWRPSNNAYFAVTVTTARPTFKYRRYSSPHLARDKHIGILYSSTCTWKSLFWDLEAGHDAINLVRAGAYPYP